MIALYTRVSTQEQAEHGHSINEQNSRLKNYCEAMGWQAYKLYSDPGYSGANTNRPALKQLLRDVEKGKVEKVLVYRLDRLSRSQKDTLMLIEDNFLSNGCDFISISENFDTSTPLGRAMIGILSVFAQLERETIKERMKMGKAARAKEGKYNGGRYVPIGYDYIDGHLIINDFEKMQILQIFDDYMAGIGFKSIADSLNQKGWVHKHGKWCNTTVKGIITSKIICGYLMYNGEWIKGEHEPIISDDLYEKAHKIFIQKKKDTEKRNSRPGKAQSYLSGLLYCGKCGEKCAKVTKIKRINYDYYACNSKKAIGKGKGLKNCGSKYWKMNELDTVIFDEIRKLKFEPDKSTTKPKKINYKPILAQIDRIEKQIDKLLELYSVGNMPIESLQSKIQQLNDQKTALEADMNQPEPEQLSQDEAAELVSSFDDVLERGNFDEIRSVLLALIDRIELNDDIKIYWSFS